MLEVAAIATSSFCLPVQLACVNFNMLLVGQNFNFPSLDVALAYDDYEMPFDTILRNKPETLDWNCSPEMTCCAYLCSFFAHSNY